MGDQWINVAASVPYTEAEGPGARYALWVQGCPLRCAGCCNPHMLEDREASLMTVDEVVADILAAPGIEGVTFIGGEPFWQAAALSEVARRVRAEGLSVMVFSGLTKVYMARQDREDWNQFLGQIDLLIDGPYIKSRHVDDRRWVGSSNQRTHFLTERYRALSDEEQGWAPEPNTIEVRMVGNQISINGFPEESIVELSRASIRPKYPKQG
jgi:anaerobic ribonucleoside-triphosphate reductase activating protein